MMEYRISPGRLRIGDFSLYFERIGQGPPLVFLHGLGGNHLSWWQQVPYFMRWYECITLDQRSFAQSPDPEGLFNRAHPGDLGRLLDDLEIERAVLVGQSMGGWTIVGYALEHPERVAGLVMADTPGGIAAPEIEIERPGSPLKFDMNPPIGTIPAYANDLFARRPELAFLYDEIRLLGANPPSDAIARLGSIRHPIGEARERLTMPVLCLVGEQDALIPPRVIQALAEALPAARTVSVPDCGHSIYFERPAVFNQIVRDFLREIDYPGIVA